MCSLCRHALWDSNHQNTKESTGALGAIGKIYGSHGSNGPLRLGATIGCHSQLQRHIGALDSNALPQVGAVIDGAPRLQVKGSTVHPQLGAPLADLGFQL